jgi:hypothetical protein
MVQMERSDSTTGLWSRLLQFCILRLGSDEDGDVRVGVFPEHEEILIRRLGLGGVALQLFDEVDDCEKRTHGSGESKQPRY